MLILYKVDIFIISFKCNLFLNVVHLTLNNTSLLHVLIHDIYVRAQFPYYIVRHRRNMQCPSL